MAETPPEQLPPLQYAALQSRLPYETLSAQETALFADVLKNNTVTVTKLLVYVRNRILQLWLDNPKHQLLMDNAIKHLEAPYTNQDRSLAQKMFAFLERQSYINFGVFERIKIPSPPNKKRVIVIGAGIAGITAAQQLTFFGFDVIVLEARDYVGGRIATYKRNNYIGELGAMVVAGLFGNPIAVLAKQIPNLDLQDVKALVQLFDPTGNKLAQEKDHRVHQEFLRLLEASSYLSKELDFNYVNNQPIALGQALEWLIKLQEKRVKEKQVDHWKNIIELQEKMKANQRAMRNLKEHMAKIFAAQKDLGETKNQRSINEEFIFRSKIYDLKQCVKEWEVLNEERAKMENKLEELEKNPPTDVYLSAQDRQVLDWHFANLESANSATLDDLSLRNWDLDEEFKGANKMIRNGFTVIPLTMSRGLNVKLSTAVKQVRYTNEGVEILAQSTKSSGTESSPSLETFTGDAVLCTLPLGVLKQTDPSKSNVVSFLPALPDWKMAAVNKMGYGNQNKVLLGFDKIFWEQHLPVFGHIGSTTASRGELFTFFTISPKTPVLLALVSGEAANIMEEVNDDVIVGRCIAVLKGMYGLGNVPQPKDTVVTRWRKDPYARGSFSYVAKGASGQEFDQLAEPVCVPFTENDPPAAKQPRLFFAGEHTSRKYFSTVHGAILSGLREAARIADTFLGPATAPK